MSRIPPGLLYLTIYNPTLRPREPTDDEDAEEQAHILFYTGRERAVSRDKILRQVGLAKALINFSGMFDGTSVCENVHSQSRRMIMLSPEPNFWIHACLELARVPRPVVTRGKNKGKGKAKDSTTAKPEVVYDYQDGSLHDLALRTHLLRGYELFKLTHGSFASILTSLGQEALGLQIERFFTVWAWKWDPEEDTTFASHLGPALHPQYKLLAPILDAFLSNLELDTTTFALSPPHFIPSTALISSKHIPPCLSQHIMSRIPPPPPLLPVEPPKQSTPPPSNDSSNEKPPSNAATDPPTGSGSDDKPSDASKGGNAFLHNVGGAMGTMVDVRKWNWPGYLTFGKSGSPSKIQTPAAPTPSPPVPKQEDENAAPAPSGVAEHPAEGLLQVKHGEIDTESLHDAINSEHVHSPQPSHHGLSPASHSPSIPATPASVPSPLAVESKPESVADHETETPVPMENVHDENDDDENENSPEAKSEATSHSPSIEEPQDPVESEEPEEPMEPEEPVPSFNLTSIHLAEGDDPSATSRKRVLHLTKHPLTIALIVEPDHEPNDIPLAKACLEALKQIEDAIAEEEAKSLVASLPNVNKILEKQDRFVISTGKYTTTSLQGFDSRSEHLFNGQEILRSEHDVQEVFSRRQNPQHWHIARRGLGTDREGNAVDGEVYMEIARKESTLTDVDNELAGVVRKSLE